MKFKFVNRMAFSLISILISLTSCNYHSTTEKDSSLAPSSGLDNPPPSGPGSGPIEPTIRWHDVQANVFDTSCTSCHSRNSLRLSFSTAANVRPYATRINNEVFLQKTMPPSGSLSSSQQQVLRTWLTTGMSD